MVNLQINYIHHQQLSSFYVGIELLRQAAKIKVDFKYDSAASSLPLLYCHLNGKRFCIDCLDGLNWVMGSQEDNLQYFKSEINADFIFKRSYTPMLNQLKPSTKVLPFGFNYPMGLRYQPKIYQFRQFVSNPYWMLRYHRMLSGYFDFRTFEAKPILPKIPKVLFQVRLWDPSDAKDPENQSQRTRINQFRIDCIRALKNQFPAYFLGGVTDSEYARLVCPDLILDKDRTQRNSYFSFLRKSAIGISTTGLHNSIGWKMGEYIAASKAIVSEDLCYRVPGNFQPSQNYLSFKNTDELLIQIDRLLSRPYETLEMMQANHLYYQNFLSPEQLVWNILKQIQE